MNAFWIIQDKSIKFINARNVLEEGCIYAGDNNWTKLLDNAKKYEDTDTLEKDANELYKDCPVRLFRIQIDGPRINYAERPLTFKQLSASNE